jgi:hypothetical protein
VRASHHADDEIGGQPTIVRSGRRRVRAIELERNPGVAAVEQVQITDLEAIKMLQAAPPHRPRQCLERHRARRANLRKNLRVRLHDQRGVERLIAQRHHHLLEAQILQSMHSRLHPLRCGIGAVNGFQHPVQRGLGSGSRQELGRRDHGVERRASGLDRYRYRTDREQFGTDPC